MLRPRVHQSVFFPMAGVFFQLFSMGTAHFFKCQDKTLHSSLSLSSQPTNQSGGGVGLPTVLRPNNNGEVNIACLEYLFSLLDQIAGLP